MYGDSNTEDSNKVPAYAYIMLAMIIGSLCGFVICF